MLETRDALPVKVITGVLWNDDACLATACRMLEELWGEVEDATRPMPFTFTDYYREEMGEGIQRQLMSFRQVQRAEDLPSLKAATNRVEGLLCRAGRRSVNLDVGYLDYHRLVLASTKEGRHKIYVGSGIWADLTLLYENGGYHPLPWTFADFRTGSYDEFLCRVRARYKEQVRAGEGAV